MSASEGQPACEVCGKPAIGIQSLGCCAATVCAEHAEAALRDAKPGEMVVWGSCVYHRFDEPRPEGGEP